MARGDGKAAQEAKKQGRGKKVASRVVKTDVATWRSPVLINGSWRVRRVDLATGKVKTITLKWTDDHGETQYPESREKADEVIQDLVYAERAEAEHARKAPGERKVIEIKLKDALAKWLELVEVRASTREAYEAENARLVDVWGAGKLVLAITLEDVEDLFFKTWKKRAGATKIGRLNQLSRFLSWAVRRDYAHTNVAALIDRPKAWTKQKAAAAEETGQALTIEEQRKLMRACFEPVTITKKPKEGSRKKREWTETHTPPQCLRDFVFLTLRTGLRWSNVMGNRRDPNATGLRWCDVDLEKGTLTIDKDRMKSGRRFHVPIHEEVVEYLRARRAELGKVASKDPIVEPHKQLRKSFKAALARAGIEDREGLEIDRFRPHDLRHSFCSTVEGYVSAATATLLMDHSKRSITQRYTHKTTEEVREELNRVPQLLAPAPPELVKTVNP